MLLITVDMICIFHMDIYFLVDRILKKAEKHACVRVNQAAVTWLLRFGDKQHEEQVTDAPLPADNCCCKSIQDLTQDLHLGYYRLYTEQSDYFYIVSGNSGTMGGLIPTFQSNREKTELEAYYKNPDS